MCVRGAPGCIPSDKSPTRGGWTLNGMQLHRQKKITNRQMWCQSMPDWNPHPFKVCNAVGEQRCCTGWKSSRVCEAVACVWWTCVVFKILEPLTLWTSSPAVHFQLKDEYEKEPTSKTEQLAKIAAGLELSDLFCKSSDTEEVKLSQVLWEHASTHKPLGKTTDTNESITCYPLRSLRPDILDNIVQVWLPCMAAPSIKQTSCDQTWQPNLNNALICLASVRLLITLT